MTTNGDDSDDSNVKSKKIKSRLRKIVTDDDDDSNDKVDEKIKSNKCNDDIANAIRNSDDDNDNEDDDDDEDDDVGENNDERKVEEKTYTKKIKRTSVNADTHNCSQNNIRHDETSQQLFKALSSLTKAESGIKKAEEKRLIFSKEIDKHHSTIKELLPNLTRFNEQLNKLIAFVQMSYPGYQTVYKHYLSDKNGTNKRMKSMSSEEFKKKSSGHFKDFQAMKDYYHKTPKRYTCSTHSVAYFVI